MPAALPPQHASRMDTQHASRQAGDTRQVQRLGRCSREAALRILSSRHASSWVTCGIRRGWVGVSGGQGGGCVQRPEQGLQQPGCLAMRGEYGGGASRGTHLRPRYLGALSRPQVCPFPQ